MTPLVDWLGKHGGIASCRRRRIGAPEYIAHTASYFLDDRAGLITGPILYVCGVMTVGVAGI